MSFVIIAVKLGLIILGALAIVALATVIAVWVIYTIYIAKLRYKTFEADALVTQKEHQRSCCTALTMAIKVLAPQFHGSNYNVYLLYENQIFCIDDEKLYARVNQGDIVRVKVHNGYNEQNELEHVYLSA